MPAGTAAPSAPASLPDYAHDDEGPCVALSNEQTLETLRGYLPQVGGLVWIGVRPERRGQMMSLQCDQVLAERGLAGDRRAERAGGKRQITLVQLEHLPVIAALCGRERVMPEQLRRNLVVSGVNLLALHDRSFLVGEVLLRGTGYCQPCSRMEESLGPGGYNAMRGHGGITAEVLRGGSLSLGDAVKVAPDDLQSPPTLPEPPRKPVP
jgi:MOSC domain-containing protein YiiM